MRILIVGCGDVGLRAARLLAGRARIFGLIRSPARRSELRAAGITPILADLDDRASLQRLAGLADAVLHFAPPPAQGETDPRTRRLLAALGRPGSLAACRTLESPAAKLPRRPIFYRLLAPGNNHAAANPTTTALAGAASRYRRPKSDRLPAQLIYISTSGVYGDCAGAEVAETWPARPGNTRAKRRADAEAQLRQFGRNGVRVSILRAPGIYAQDRMPADRVRKGLPAILQDDDVHTNHIHADDLARLAIAALFRGRPNRLYNAVDDSGLKMGDWFDVVADHLHLPRPPRLPREQVIAAVTPAMRTFLTESRRLSNARIKTELGFRLRYPTVREGLQTSIPISNLMIRKT